MKAMSVKDQWESYAAHVLPPDCGLLQRQETRRAFYAGAFAMLMMSANVAHMTDDEGVSYLEGLRRELERFQRDVAMGGA